MKAWSQFPARNHRDREGLGSSLSALGRRTVTGSASQAKVVARPTEEQLRQRPRPPQCGVARARGAVCAAVPACSHGCPAAGMHGAGGEGQRPGARHSGLLLPRQDGATPTVGNSRERVHVAALLLPLVSPPPSLEECLTCPHSHFYMGDK